MSNTRRKFFQDAAVLGAGLFGINSQLRARTPESQSHGHTARNTPPAASPPMLTPDVPDLPYKMDGATKVFHLIAEPVQCKIAPFKTLDVWGYNGSCPGPTIQVQQGDRVRVFLKTSSPNRLRSTGTDWKFPSSKTASRGSARNPSLRAKPTSTSSPCTRKAPSSTTRTAPC